MVTGEAVLGVVVVNNVVVSRHPPNQPYLTQDVVGCSDVDVDVEVAELEVVLSSRQPRSVSHFSRIRIRVELTPPTRRFASGSASQRRF